MGETFPLLAFLAFSTYFLHKMEKEYDGMVRSVIRVKTYKQEQAEKEDEVIILIKQIIHYIYK